MIAPVCWRWFNRVGSSPNARAGIATSRSVPLRGEELSRAIAFDLVEAVQDRFDRLVEMLAFGRDVQAPVAAFEDIEAELRLQLVDLPADRRLGQAECFGGVFGGAARAPIAEPQAASGSWLLSAQGYSRSKPMRNPHSIK